MTKFGLLLADPPWQFDVRTPRGRAKCPDAHYKTMNRYEIMALPVSDVMAQNSACLMWATWPTLPDAFKVLEAWGFTYRTGLPWVKISHAGAVQIGTGYHVRNCSEVLLVGTRGKGAWPGVGNQPLGVIWDEESGVLFHPRGEHSRKPETQYEIGERYPGPHLSLFDRPDGLLPTREGWTFIGDEIDHVDARTALKRLANGVKL